MKDDGKLEAPTEDDATVGELAADERIGTAELGAPWAATASHPRETIQAITRFLICIFSGDEEWRHGCG